MTVATNRTTIEFDDDEYIDNDFTMNKANILDYTYDELMCKSKDELLAIQSELNKMLKKLWIDDSDKLWGRAYAVYSDVAEILDDMFREENKEDFNRFYNEHIKGHTEEELKYGNEIAHCCYDYFKDIPEEKKTVGYIFDNSYLDFYVERYCREHNVSDVEKARKALEFSIDYGYYSDYHKDMYGYRPRHI